MEDSVRHYLKWLGLKSFIRQDVEHVRPTLADTKSPLSVSEATSLSSYKYAFYALEPHADTAHEEMLYRIVEALKAIENNICYLKIIKNLSEIDCTLSENYYLFTNQKVESFVVKNIDTEKLVVLRGLSSMIKNPSLKKTVWAQLKSHYLGNQDPTVV